PRYQKADLAVADLTITAARQSVIDFTLPFMEFGIGILHKRPLHRYPPQVLSSMALDFWRYLAGFLVATALLLCVIGRLMPDEWVPTTTRKIGDERVWVMTN